MSQTTIDIGLGARPWPALPGLAVSGLMLLLYLLQLLAPVPQLGQ